MSSYWKKECKKGLNEERVEKEIITCLNDIENTNSKKGIYIYGDDGRLQNSGFLDYRIPVASDLPMIDTVIIEVPNPGHPYGVRGVGETSICPPLAAIANAVSNAAGVRLKELPMSPVRILEAVKNKT